MASDLQAVDAAMEEEESEEEVEEDQETDISSSGTSGTEPDQEEVNYEEDDHEPDPEPNPNPKSLPEDFEYTVMLSSSLSWPDTPANKTIGDLKQMVCQMTTGWLKPEELIAYQVIGDHNRQLLDAALLADVEEAYGRVYVTNQNPFKL